MSKSTKKSQSYNEDILIALEKKYGVGKTFIRACIRGDRDGLLPDTISKEYKKADNAAKKAIEDKITNA
ncbi:hypothetical protein [Leeuwenhoekiella parthenopeia]|uniref:Uncharacterized protein n=1 Tax=Leeuwenhoekiella parthenopeia TaxID=2890320 RepID=A0ABS8GN15_9FLAO|nr:hypothetical protein [Leeuwenhoekiella parthenopeia]MCC4211386.1 hypothetical protein [Leeuwenhoekiella parthenopeia]